MIPYVENFYSGKAQNELFEFVRALPFTRLKNRRNQNSSIRKVSYGTWSPLLKARYSGTLPIDDAPDQLKELAEAMSEFRGGMPINYISCLGYVDECDHIGWHKHYEDDGNKDQSVTVISLGEVRTLSLRPLKSKDKNQYEEFDTAPGSLYVLPHDYNTTHEHAVLDDKRPRRLRISINCKSLSPADIERLTINNEAKPPKAAPFVREPGPPRIYDIKSGTFPKEGVYVGRKYGAWPSTPFGNHKRLNGHAWKAEVARLMASPEFHKEVFEYLGGSFETLRGRDLLCWCSPKEMPDCHARAWLELANAK